ncbi:hypothetical protein, partial [Serratia ureilytica]
RQPSRGEAELITLCVLLLNILARVIFAKKKHS